uniref:Uncharacterized protein n=1 Tax=Cucumis melo TaxID=3656 RepID=A0A9I9EL62_CUCME
MKVAGTLPIEITGLLGNGILDRVYTNCGKEDGTKPDESLNSLHSNAHLIHRAISPEVLPESIRAVKPYLQKFIDV